MNKAAAIEEQQSIPEANVTHVSDVDDIEMPTPNPNAIAAEQGAAPEKTPDGAKPLQGPLDRRGRAFDPAIHECDEAKQPILGKNGKLKIRRGGDMRSYVASARGADGAIPPGGAAAPGPVYETSVEPMVDYNKVAETWVLPALDTATAVLGSEWTFEQERRQRYVAAGARLAALWDVHLEMHPLVELAALAVGDVVARAELPQTKSMLERIRAKVSTWWSSLWGRRRAAPPPPPPPVGPMHDQPPTAAAAAT